MKQGIRVAGPLVAALMALGPAGFRPVTAVAAPAAGAMEPRLDPLQQAVVDSLAFPPRTSPSDLLDAVVRAADVEAAGAARGYFARLGAALEAAGERRTDLLADLGDAVSPAALARAERFLAPREPAARPMFNAIRAAARERRRDPALLARAAADLRAGVAGRRATALDTLRRARVDALPALVDILQGTDPREESARRVARLLVHDLGPEARQPLVAWLGSNDVSHWPGIIEALAAAEVDDIDTFLLGPALVPDTPPAARSAAVALLARRAAERRSDQPPTASPPAREAAVARLAARLDRVLSPAGLPQPDCLLTEPVSDPARVAEAAGGLLDGSVDRFVWNEAARRFDQLSLPPRAARLQEALHVARDLMALAPDDPAAVDLACLTRLEAAVMAGAAAAAPADPAAAGRLREALAPPEGFSPARAADVLERAVTHGMWEASAAAMLAIETGSEPGRPLPPAARKAILRALAVPDPAVQFAAARACAQTAGDPPFPGSSRVVEVLVHAATSTGIDRVVVAHPEADVCQELATDVSRFGLLPVRVATGREAILAARGSADTVLVIVAARLVGPGAFETVQFLRQQGLGAAPPVLVVVDPLDDDGRGCFLAQLLMKFAPLEGVAIVDRLDSFFEPVVDAATGATLVPARFPDALVRAGGLRAVDPTARVTQAETRLARAREALDLLADLGRRGFDVSAAATAARDGLSHDALAPAATGVLAVIGRPAAQQLLASEAERSDLDPARRRALLEAFAASTARYGILLESRRMLGMYARYNASRAAARGPVAGVIDVLETPRPTNPVRPAHAAPDRSTR